MHEIPLILDLVIIFGIAFAIMLAALRFKLPGLIGLLVTGAICGPKGLGLITASAEVEALSEIGVALLLFGVGLELSLKRFLRTFRQVLVGGGFQVTLTLVVGILFSAFIGRPWGEAFFFGCLLSLSSTAIVLRLLQERSEIGTRHGKLVLSILIFQDLIVIPMMLIVPLLGGEPLHLGPSLFWIVLRVAVILGGTLVGGLWLVPRLLSLVARVRNDQLFLLTVLFIFTGTAWLTSHLGLSLALGAFLAGLIISESEYHHHVLGHFFPFQEVFVSFFFISTGMLLDIRFVLDYWWLIGCSMIGLCLMKATIISLVAMFMGYPMRTAVLAGLTLCQVGEFSFILIRAGMLQGIADEWYYNLFLSSTLFTMAFTPLIISSSRKIADWVHEFSWWPQLRDGLGNPKEKPAKGLEHHVIIAGFGAAGRNLAYSLKKIGISYTIIELNPNTVKKYRTIGEPIQFGNASHAHVLRNAKIERAACLAILVNNRSAANRIVTAVNNLSSAVHILACSRADHEVKELYQLGAHDIIPEEFEASVELLTRVLHKYLIPKETIDTLTKDLRIDRCKVLHIPESRNLMLSSFDLKAQLNPMEIKAFRVCVGSDLEGKTLQESALKESCHVIVLLIRRGKEFICKLKPETSFQVDDVVILFGAADKFSSVSVLFT